MDWPAGRAKVPPLLLAGTPRSKVAPAGMTAPLSSEAVTPPAPTRLKVPEVMSRAPGPPA